MSFGGRVLAEQISGPEFNFQHWKANKSVKLLKQETTEHKQQFLSSSVFTEHYVSLPVAITTVFTLDQERTKSNRTTCENIKKCDKGNNFFFEKVKKS